MLYRGDPSVSPLSENMGKVRAIAMKNNIKPGRMPSHLVLVFFMLAAGIAVAGLFYYHNQQDNIKSDVQKSIAAIAELKADHIRKWRQERLADAAVIYNDPLLSDHVERWLQNPEDADVRRKTLQWMGSLNDHHEYKNAFLVDAGGAPLLSLPEGSSFGAGIEHHIRTAIQEHKAILSNLQLWPDTGEIVCNLVIPIMRSQNGERQAIAAVYLQIDPHTYLYPLVQSWPTPSATGETILVSRDGDDALILNELRFRKNTALILRLPVTERERPAAMAALGFEGVMEGADYRGVQVLAAVKAIPDSPWALVAKMDVEEIYAPIRERAWFVMFLGLFMFVGAGVGIALIWSRNQADFYRKEFQTEREKLELAQRYEYLTRYANDIILMVNSNGSIVEANDRAVLTYGYTRREFIGLNILDIRSPESLADFGEQWRKTGEGFGCVFETTHIKKDGATFPVEVSSRVVRLGDDDFYWSIVRDISERKRAEAKIFHLNRLYAVLSQVNQAVVRARERMPLLREVCRIAVEYGEFRMAWIGMVDKEMKRVEPVARYGAGKEYLSRIQVSIEDGQTGRGPVGRAIREGKTYVCADIDRDPQVALWREDALAFGFHSVASIPIVCNQKVLGAFNVYSEEINFFDEEELQLLEEMCADVSFGIETIDHEIRRKQAEEALRESEASYRALAENLPGVVYRVLLRENRRIQFFNDMFETITGYPSDEFNRCEACPMDAIILPEDRGRVVATIENALQQNIPFKIEYRIQHKDGTIRHFAEAGKPSLDSGNKPLFIDGAVFDESNRKRLENQLRQAQKMEAIGTLAGGIAHDFNNILTPIIGYTEMALYDISRSNPLWRNMQQVLSSANRAKELVKQILTFGRQTEQERRPIRIDLIVKETLKLLRASLPATIEILQHIEGGSNTIMGDPTQIHQVLINLCANAAHAMREKGGVLEVTLTSVELDPDFTSQYANMEAGPYLRLSVRDTGHGMTQDVKQRIFDPYFTTKTQGEGTGLGLAVVYGIVKSYGGAISVYSEPGSGTVFHVYFRRIEIEAPRQTDTLKPLPVGKGRVLFVDDEETIIDLGLKMLERLGYETRAVGSSKQALEIFRENPGAFDLVMTDQTMPEMTGAELAQEILTLSPDTPIILCTGFSESINEEKARSLGIAGFLMKPVILSEVARIINRVMEGKSK